VKWLQRPSYSRVELIVAGLIGYSLAWLMMAGTSCIKRPPAPSPVVIDTGADVCGVTLVSNASTITEQA
jgi:hypothetical protein